MSVPFYVSPEQIMRDKADFVSAGNDEDGVAVAIDRLLADRAI